MSPLHGILDKKNLISLAQLYTVDAIRFSENSERGNTFRTTLHTRHRERRSSGAIHTGMREYIRTEQFVRTFVQWNLDRSIHTVFTLRRMRILLARMFVTIRTLKAQFVVAHVKCTYFDLMEILGHVAWRTRYASRTAIELFWKFAANCFFSICQL